MSAYALTIGLPHDSDTPVVITGPDVPLVTQRETFKAEFMAARIHKKFRQVDLVDSRRGVSKRKKFITPAEAKRREKAAADEDLATAPTAEAPAEQPDDVSSGA